MSKYQEDRKRYIVAKKIDEVESLANIDDYTGNIYWTESIENARKFETKDEANKFIKLQSELSKLLDKECEFKLLEEHRVITVI